MKESFWGYWIIVLGIFVVIIMMLVSNVTTTNTQDYYLVKNVTESAMVDAIDYAYYRQYKELKINREKFVENFLRRFAENVSLNTYTIDFYDIYEAPPKVSVKVTTKSGNFMVNGDAASFDIVNKVDAILELTGSSADGGTHNSDITDSGTTNNSGNHDSSDENEPDNEEDNSNENDTVPKGSSIRGFSVNVRQTVYYDCDSYGMTSTGVCKASATLKKKFKNDPELYINTILNDYQSYYGIVFTKTEKQTFLERARNEFKGLY